jgi:putative transposase
MSEVKLSLSELFGVVSLEATGEPLPRYGTVYDLVREIPRGLLTLAHQSSKAYSEGFDLVHRREAARSNAIWQADHAQLSILLFREDGHPGRIRR